MAQYARFLSSLSTDARRGLGVEIVGALGRTCPLLERSITVIDVVR
jgi:hypothetical protein